MVISVIYHLRISDLSHNKIHQRWAGPQLVPLCAFPQLAQQGNLLRMCALIRRQLTAKLRLRTKKYSCGPYFHCAQYRRERVYRTSGVIFFIDYCTAIRDT